MKAETANPPDMGVADSLTVATKPNVPRWTFDAQLPRVEAAGTIDDDTWFHMARGWFEDVS